jgi:hypothetical protein
MVGNPDGVRFADIDPEHGSVETFGRVFLAPLFQLQPDRPLLLARMRRNSSRSFIRSPPAGPSQ